MFFTTEEKYVVVTENVVTKKVRIWRGRVFDEWEDASNVVEMIIEKSQNEIAWIETIHGNTEIINRPKTESNINNDLVVGLKEECKGCSYLNICLRSDYTTYRLHMPCRLTKK